jgi:aspartyl-tRNA(Asn)/glutamyl-tRNA(Gln) amidotransferase subunit B
MHVQINSLSKLFSRASAAALQSPNTQVSPLDMALPGTLPVLNERCVEAAVLTGLALGGEVQRVSKFDRKHYMYSDLPHGYQITQKDHPIVLGGSLAVDHEGARVGIERVQLEIDSGKSSHDVHPYLTLIDLTGGGVGLMEIVTAPDIHSAEEAALFVGKMQALLSYIGVSTVAMEEGAMRCDVNISVSPDPAQGLGERVEIKNLSSIRAIRMAIEYEIARQSRVVAEGGQISRETRQFDVNANKSILMRSKEDILQYRFYPEPDVLELRVDDDLLGRMQAALPELPDAVFARYTQQLGLSAYDADVIVSTPGAISVFEQILGAGEGAGAGAKVEGETITPKVACNWLANELLGRINRARREDAEETMTLSSSPASVAQLRDIVQAVVSGHLTGVQGKELLDELFAHRKTSDDDAAPVDVAALIAEYGAARITDEDQIRALCASIMKQHPTNVSEFRETKNKRLIGFLIKQAIQASNKQADPKLISKTMFGMVNGDEGK